MTAEYKQNSKHFMYLWCRFEGKTPHRDTSDDAGQQLTSAAYNNQSGRFPAAPQTAQPQR